MFYKRITTEGNKIYYFCECRDTSNLEISNLVRARVQEKNASFVIKVKSELHEFEDSEWNRFAAHAKQKGIRHR